MSLPKDLMQSFSKLTREEGKAAVRLSLRASNRVQAKHIRNLIRKETSRSRQSTGATYRAATSKVSYPQKGFEARGYAIAGVSRKNSEISYKGEPGTSRPNKKLNVRKNTTTILSVSSRSKNRASIAKKSYVRSWQRSSLRSKGTVSKVFNPRKNKVGNSTSRIQKNIPDKYWHLINKGFTHFSGSQFPGYKFVERTASATSEESASKFITTFQSQLSRIFS